jgi:hypothetical protein
MKTGMGYMPMGIVVALVTVLALGTHGAMAQPPPPPKPPVPPVPPIPTVPTLPTVPTVPQVPAVPENPGELGDMVTPLAAKMLVTAQPRRATGLPARFRLNGWLRPPMRLDRVSGFFKNTFGIDLGVCTGAVTIAYRARGQVFARRRASLTRTCTFQSEIGFRSRKRLGRGGRLRATARFAGNRLLGPVHHSVGLRVLG